MIDAPPLNRPPTKRMRLIVNGDDFGISEEVNEAVVRAFREGALTSCSLMVAGKAFHQAVRMAKQNEGLAVGLHLVVVHGSSVLPQADIPALVNRQGHFSNDPTPAGLKYFFSRAARRQLRKELAAQFERFASTGLACSHIDGHLHMHVHPVVFDAAMELGIQYGVRRMRVPLDDYLLAARFDGNRSWGRALHRVVFGGLCRRMKRKLAGKSFAFPERVYGNIATGKMSEEYALFALDHLHDETNEMYFHPALYPDDTDLDEPRAQALAEFRILTSGRFLGRIRELGIVPSNYADLKASL